MVRSMYSGVAGMKAHQTKLDTIGNNISNVYTYGYKASRVTFRDVYYQSMRGASAGTGTRGGLNPTQVGYGAKLASIDVQHGTSTLTTTGFGLDAAIAGDGFFQVQDSEGNTFYTRAGMLDVDSYGNLIDSNGNFVLGVSGSPVGKAPASQRIQFNIPTVEPSSAKATVPLNGINYTLTTSKQSDDANVSFNFAPDSTMAIGEKVSAMVTSSGIVIKVNPKENFADVEELNRLMNDAIKEANGGAEHPAGTFTLSTDTPSKFQNLTGAELVGSNFGVKLGKVPMPTALKQYMSISKVGENFSAAGPAKFEFENTVARVPAYGTAGEPTTEGTYTVKVTIDGKTYSGVITEKQMQSASSLVLKQTPDVAGDTITIDLPTEKTLVNALAKQGTDGKPDLTGGKLTFDPAQVGPNPRPNPDPNPPTATDWTSTDDSIISAPSNDLGLQSQPFKLTGGTAGGAQTLKDLSNLSIGADGVVSASHNGVLLELGRIDLATFDNPAGLAQAGNSYFTETANSGKAGLAKPGLGGTGALVGSSLEMSNVDLSQEFADIITTQRGFQANSRLITVSDTILEELINLKR